MCTCPLTVASIANNSQHNNQKCLLRQIAIEGRMKKEGLEKGRGGARTDVRTRYGLHKVVGISRPF